MMIKKKKLPQQIKIMLIKSDNFVHHCKNERFFLTDPFGFDKIPNLQLIFLNSLALLPSILNPSGEINSVFFLYLDKKKINYFFFFFTSCIFFFFFQINFVKLNMSFIHI